MPAPKVSRRFLKNRRGIGEQLGVEQHAAFEGIVSQDPLAKGVNGKNACVIEVLHRQVEVADALLNVVALEVLRHDLILRLTEAQVVECVAQPFADSIPQFLGRSYGVSNGEDLLDGN